MDSYKSDQNGNNPDLQQSINNSENLTVTLQRELTFRQAIEDSIPCGIAVVDDTGKQVYVNKSFCRMIGREEKDLLGKHPPFEYWADHDIENIKKAFQFTLDNNSPPKGGFNLFFSHKSGKTIPVNVTISPLRQENNKIFYLASVSDISEFRRTEEELRRSQLLLLSSIESQKNTIIFFVDREFKYLYFNTAHREAMKYAYNVDIEIGMSMVKYMSLPVDQKAAMENFERAFKGESFTYLNTFGTVNRDYYEVLSNPIRNDKNQIIGCTGFARNITERVNADQALKDSETKFKEIINQINDIIIVFDENGKVIIWNKGAETTLGMKAEEVLNRRIADIQYQLTPPPNNDRALIEKSIEGIIKMQTPEIFNQIIDSEIITNGSDKPKSIQSTVFPIRLNGTHLFCTVIRDITEIRRYEREMLKIGAEKEKFYSTIAQYLYNPFNLFHNFSRLMAEDLDNLPIKEIQKMAVMMSKSASNMYSLLDNLLQWTKLNHGKISYEPQKLNFNRVSHDAVSVLKSSAESKQIRINHDVGDEFNVFADVFMLKTVLRNLVSKAMNLTESGGQIEIYARHTDSDAVISVRHNGNGMSSDYNTKVFDISHLNTVSGSEEDIGATLGLFLCKQYVDLHGGKIWAETEKGKSSEFKFTLPLKIRK